MKKLLLVSTAIAGVALLSSPASAAVKMDLGGFFRGYGVYADNNEDTGTANSLYSFEFRRDAEVHANGETTLDNGLTVGAHAELKIANGSNSTVSDEIFGYASGGWGRFNLGVEDGAAYLLQIAAPSADSNVDGLRTFIQALNVKSTATDANFSAVTANSNAFFGNLDYDQGDFAKNDRLTYLTPKFDGFQAGVSYAPKQGITSNTLGMATDQNGPFGISVGSITAAGAAQYQNLWEASARYDGEFEGFGFALGGGYSDSDVETTPTAAFLEGDDGAGTYYINDGIRSYNAGLTFSSQGFSLGGTYKQTDTSRTHDGDAGIATEVISGDITAKTWVIGAGYDNGPWHGGASYLNTKTNLDALDGTTALNDIAATSYEDTKYTVGGGYTFGPGMTFRGAVAWGTFDNTSATAVPADDNDFTQVTVGADVQF
jgi:hypothetical protein